MRNDGAGYDNSDAERSASESDEDGLKKKRQRIRVATQYVPVKLWITERAEMPEEDIELAMFEEAGKLMSLSGLKKLPGHKGLDTDLALWKRSGKPYTTKDGITYVPYRCPMRHRCKCKCLIRTATGKNFLQIE